MVDGGSSGFFSRMRGGIVSFAALATAVAAIIGFGVTVGNVTRDFDEMKAQVKTLSAKVAEQEALIASLDGGQAGAAGPAGERGEAGVVGPAGPTGAVGPAGKDGANGRDGADGADGRSAELRVAGGKVQWRLAGDAAWTDLYTVPQATSNGVAETPVPTTPDPMQPTFERLRAFQDTTIYVTDVKYPVGIGDANSANTPFILDGKTSRLKPGQYLQLPTRADCKLIYDRLSTPLAGDEAQAVDLTIMCNP